MSKAEIDVLRAENARLRDALGGLVDHCWRQEKQLTEELHHMHYSGESLPLCEARAALKQENLSD